MFLVKLLWETDGQLHPLADVHSHLPCVAQVMVDVTSQLEHLHEGKVCFQSQGLEGPQGRALPDQPPQ